jgi:hypothetical protein
MNAIHRKPTGGLQLVDRQFRTRLMVDELIEQLIRKQLSEARAAQYSFGSAPRGSRATGCKVIPMRLRDAQARLPGFQPAIYNMD